MKKTKQQRANEAFNYVRAHYDIHSKTAFALSIGLTRPAVSSALNGNVRYLTDGLFTKICEHYTEINLDYLLTGNGELLLPVIETAENKKVGPSNDEPTAHGDLLEIYSKMIRGVDDLRVQLRNELNEIRKIKADLIEATEAMKAATKRINSEAYHLDYSDASPRLAAEDSPKVSPKTQKDVK